MLILANLLICALFVGWLINRYDLYDKEPWYMLLLAVILGTAFMHLSLDPQVWSITILYPHLSFAQSLALVAATHEELAKLLAVILIATIFRGVFKDPMDGLIYGSMVGIGAAIDESFGLLSELEGPLPPSEVVRIFGHAIFGGITGFGIGLYVIGHHRRHAFLALTLSASMLLHYLWDLATVELVEPSQTASFSCCMIMLCGLAIYGRLICVAQYHSRKRFNPDHHHRLFGWPISLVLKPPRSPSP
ncbi:MAG: PrsW family intramembrane metalloprotease [Phycisphaeraceae bacterium]|nr:PrsW family intramembrane metalloprotease [Phycisphaeraceae bacterium]MCW5763288.1 PrsW family intramembrane metalloprotease [Phycisphaeraceae bacterium]